MKAIITTAFLLAVGSDLMQAESYKYLEITKVDNTEAVVMADDLTLTIDGERVVFANPTGEITQMRADEISRMQFTDEKSSIKAIAADTSGPVTVYTIAGLYSGVYPSLDDALNNLPAGTYVINCGKCDAIKIYVGK